MKAELSNFESSPMTTSGVGSARTWCEPGEDFAGTTRRETLNYGLIGLYAGVLFLSAFLLMWVQPLFTKMVLPRLGGSSSVWNTAMMFFQIVLLAGYAYAHLLNRFAAPRRQPWIHGAVLLGGLLFLPLAIQPSKTPPTDHSPILWLIGLLTLSVGWPFFALSSSAPLLQAWFSRSRNRLANDPYFLYAASNFGSLLALLAFPFLLEPSLNLAEQSRLWRASYILLFVLVGMCALPLRSAAAIDDSLRDGGSLNFRGRMLATAAHMDFVGIRSIQLAVRCHVVHHHGSRVRSVAVGFAVGTLPVVIRDGVQ